MCFKNQSSDFSVINGKLWNVNHTTFKTMPWKQCLGLWKKNYIFSEKNA